MRSTHLSTIAKVRLLVGALGERLEWWRTQFTIDHAQRSLMLLFPQTPTRAALESVTEAARRTHDERLGPCSFHLFRLPVHLEDRLAGLLAKPDTNLSWPPASKDALLAELERIIAGKGGTVAEGVALRPGLGPSEPGCAKGPLCLGKPARLNQESAFKELAAVYCHAARGGVQVLPYFEE